MSSRSSKLPGMPPSHCGLLWRYCCPHSNPRSRRAAWGWSCGHVLPASSQFTIGALDWVVLGWLLRWVMQHWTGSAAGAGRPVVVEVVAVTGSAALLVGRGNSLMTEFCSLHFLHGLGAVAGRRCKPLRCAAGCELRAAAPLHYAHKGIITLVSCDKAFQDPCHSETREQKYVQQHIRICTHGVKTGLG